MVSGHNFNKCIMDMKYNMTHDDYVKILSTKKALKSELHRLKKATSGNSWDSGPPITAEMKAEMGALDFLVKNFETTVLPSIYNGTDGYETQSAFHKFADGSNSETLKKVAQTIDAISTGTKYEEGTTLQKSINSLYNEFKHLSTVPPTDQEIEQEMEKISQNTCDDEDNYENGKSNDDQLKKKTGYQLLEDWLKSLKGSDVKKKKFQQMTKMSDLQKVSAVEFIKPKALFMKKLINKEFYCKQTTESEKYMHIITDNSGSMSDFFNNRNSVITKTFESCEKIGISVETSFWNTNIYTEGPFSAQKIRNKNELKEKTLSVLPDGSDNMGRCLEQKLQILQKKKAKQYVLCISDGTGSISGVEQRKKIYELASQKNIEFKFALFSKANEMYGTKTEDIFYIYD